MEVWQQPQSITMVVDPTTVPVGVAEDNLMVAWLVAEGHSLTMVTMVVVVAIADHSLTMVVLATLAGAEEVALQGVVALLQVESSASAVAGLVT